MPAFEPIQISLLLLLGAAIVLYFGTRLLWASIPWPGLWRGVVMAVPVAALALYHAPSSPGTGVAMLVSTAVLALTLGLGVSTIDLPGESADGSPMLRMLLPLMAAVCLCGMHGELGWPQAGAIFVIGGLTLWTAAAERRTPSSTASVATILPAAILLAGGLLILVMAVKKFTQAAGNAALTPIVVLLTVPAALLAMLGLLSAESRERRPDTPQETCTGLAIASLGFGLPLLVAIHSLWPTQLAAIASTQPATQPATEPAMQPTVWQPVFMPLATWRVDTVLLVVVAILLLPIGSGRFKLGRAEGALLILLYLAYAAVATRTGAMAG